MIRVNPRYPIATADVRSSSTLIRARLAFDSVFLETLSSLKALANCSCLCSEVMFMSWQGHKHTEKQKINTGSLLY